MPIFIHKVMSSKTCSNVMSFLQDTNSQVMFHVRHFGFVRPIFWSHLWEISGLKTCLCVLDCVFSGVFSGSIFFYFYYHDYWRHVYCQDISFIMTPRHHFYGILFSFDQVKLHRNKLDLEQHPWFATFKLHRLIPSQRGDLVEIHLAASTSEFCSMVLANFFWKFWPRCLV